MLTLLSFVGDFIVIGESAVKVFRHWPKLQSHYDQKSYTCTATYHRHTGEHVLGPVPLKTTTGKPMLREDLQRMLEDAVNRENIPVKYNCKVEGYFESAGEGGVILADGRRFTAQVVAACDGVQSRSREIMSNEIKEPVNSGHAVYRASAPMKELFKRDPALEKVFGCSPSEPYLRWFSGPDCHGIVFSDGETVCWSIHHPVSLSINTVYA